MERAESFDHEAVRDVQNAAFLGQDALAGSVDELTGKVDVLLEHLADNPLTQPHARELLSYVDLLEGKVHTTGTAQQSEQSGKMRQLWKSVMIVQDTVMEQTGIGRFDRMRETKPQQCERLKQLLSQLPSDSRGFSKAYRNFGQRAAVLDQLAALEVIIDHFDGRPEELGPEEGQVSAAALGEYKVVVSKVKQNIDSCSKVARPRDLGDLFRNMQAGTGSTRVDVGRLMQAHGFKPILKDVNFAKLGLVEKDWGVGTSGTALQRLSFSGVEFIGCGFSWANMEQSSFDACSFSQCDMTKFTLGDGSRCTNCRFEECNLQGAYLSEARFEDCRFSSCDLRHSTLAQSTLKNTVFEGQTQLRGTCLMSAQVENCQISETCDTTDCMFDGTEGNFGLTQGDHPVGSARIGLMWGIDRPGATGNKVDQCLIMSAGLPVKVNYEPRGVDARKLLQEVVQLFDGLQEAGSDEFRESPARCMLEAAQQSPEQYPQVVALLRMADEVTSKTDCVVLPGGPDIEEIFYNPDAKVQGSDFRRSLLEFAVLRSAREKGVPVTGICRGCQLICVFYGGTMVNVPNQMGKIQRYVSAVPKPAASSKEAGEDVGLIRGILGKKFTSVSYHNQAVKSGSVGSQMKMVVEYEGVPKAFEGQEGCPLLALQFHPEGKGPASQLTDLIGGAFMSRENLHVWRDFVKTGEQVLLKRQNLSPDEINAGRAALKPLDPGAVQQLEQKASARRVAQKKEAILKSGEPVDLQRFPETRTDK